MPGFEFNSNTPLVAATGSFNASISTQFSRFPANFTFPALADIQVDTGSNYLPLKFNKIDAQIFDLDTGRQIATGVLGSTTVPAKAFTTIQIPLNFTYVATNDTDATCRLRCTFRALCLVLILCAGSNWYNSCRNKAAYATGTRPGMYIALSFMHILIQYSAV